MIYLLISYTHTQWFLNPWPHPFIPLLWEKEVPVERYLIGRIYDEFLNKESRMTDQITCNILAIIDTSVYCPISPMSYNIS